MPSGGADAAIIKLLGELSTVLVSGISLVSGLGGSVFMAIAVYHAYEHAQYRSDATLMQISREFFVASLLLGFTGWIATTGGMPLGGASSGYSVVQFQATGSAATEGVTMANAVLAACLSFLAVVGRVCQLQAVIACYSLGKGRGETTFFRAVGQFVLGGLLADVSGMLAALNSSLGSGFFS